MSEARRAVDEEFEAKLLPGALPTGDDAITADGLLVEAVEETSTTAEPTTEEPPEASAEEPTEKPTEEPTEEPTEVPTQTPGFGIAVAMLALIGAALVALRRRN
ncbi:hypothetical protein HSRCO_2615 [Halanaeroarchaeum sp. HSR-CO]|uniref:PGF-CTERM sorting domain-containing protein n=1 Tax=Halanaeroarchaeum sp. HSR-CO TaxID=2866382 RepID=UPI0028774E4F|nr:PGF-CTERM sorting domain-containing protein [Halanaeroarchaeum sp. HSR-CO]UWG48875.1 hypothetical protein HSRCO_2615 [Halanaeroarchaeum sp. HSR-CO]